MIARGAKGGRRDGPGDQLSPARDTMSWVIARHPACGRVVAVTVNDPTWKANAKHLAEWLQDKAERGYPTEPMVDKPDMDAFCNCFRGVE